MQHQIITTSDGSHTLFVPKLNEHYHSVNGAIQESQHIFINAGLKHILNDLESNNSRNKPTINILEIGFGTGLNALLTLLETEYSSINIFYNSIELFPISLEDAEKLNYPIQLIQFQQKVIEFNESDLEKSDLIEYKSIDSKRITELFLKLHKTLWEEEIEITTMFTLLKQKIDFSNPSQFKPDKLFDLIYFDAFAPEKQPEMWAKAVFNKIYSLCNTNAVFTTYCAKGVIRRMLQEEGFKMERLPGPPGKREILRGIK